MSLATRVATIDLYPGNVLALREEAHKVGEVEGKKYLNVLRMCESNKHYIYFLCEIQKNLVNGLVSDCSCEPILFFILLIYTFVFYI